MERVHVTNHIRSSRRLQELLLLDFEADLIQTFHLTSHLHYIANQK